MIRTNFLGSIVFSRGTRVVGKNLSSVDQTLLHWLNYVHILHSVLRILFEK